MVEHLLAKERVESSNLFIRLVNKPSQRRVSWPLARESLSFESCQWLALRVVSCGDQLATLPQGVVALRLCDTCVYKCLDWMIDVLLTVSGQFQFALVGDGLRRSQFECLDQYFPLAFDGEVCTTLFWKAMS